MVVFGMWFWHHFIHSIHRILVDSQNWFVVSREALKLYVRVFLLIVLQRMSHTSVSGHGIGCTQ